MIRWGAFLAIALFATAAATANADSNAVVQGRVYGRAGGPLAGLIVKFQSPSGVYATRTDATGRFVLFGMETDSYVATADRDGEGIVTLVGVTVESGETEYVVLQFSECASYGNPSYFVRGGPAYVLNGRPSKKDESKCL